MMSATAWIFPYSSIALQARSSHSHRFSSSPSLPLPNPTRLSAVSDHTNGSHFLGDRSFKSFTTIGRVPSDRNTKMDTAVYCSAPPGASGDATDSWELFGRKNWIFGVLLSVFVPLWKFKLGPLMQMKNQVDAAMDKTEQIAETIESVAEKVEKAADDIGNQLPEGGKLRAVVDFVEDVARETAKNANLVDEAIEKVEEIEKKLDDLVEDIQEVVDDAGGALDDTKATAKQN